MANNVAGNPFIIDTVTDTAIFTDKFKVFSMCWTSGSVADALSVADQDGNVKWASIGSIANDYRSITFPSDGALLFNGLKVATLGAGTVYLYVKRI